MLKKIMLKTIIPEHPTAPITSWRNPGKWIMVVSGFIAGTLIIALLEAHKYVQYGFW